MPSGSRSAIGAFFTIVTIFAAGCVETWKTKLDQPVSIGHFARAIVLTPDRPTAQLGQYIVRLISIADDGATQIQVGENQQLLTARPGECFVSTEFGVAGLTLDSASRSTGKAAFTLRGAFSK